MQKLSAQQVKETLARDDEVHLINVLPEKLHREKHIPGSVNVPLEQDSFMQRIEHIAGSKDARLVVYCADARCNASVKASEALEEAGFRNVADFEGGVKEWEEAGFPLEGQAV